MREEFRAALASAAAHANDVTVVVDYRQYRSPARRIACRSVEDAARVLGELRDSVIDYLYLGHYLDRGPDGHLTTSEPVIAMLVDGAATGRPWRIGQIRLTAGAPFRDPMRERLEHAGFLVAPDHQRA